MTKRRYPRGITKTAAEVDVVGKWRHMYCYLARSGATSKIKRQMRRRERREGKRGVDW